MSKFYIGFDCGTQGTKVAIYADDSTLISEANREHKILYPKPGWAEMDPNQFYRVVKEGIQECMEKGNINSKDIRGISCSGVVTGCLPIDRDWNPVGPYICYLDGRATEEAKYITENVEPLWIEESGNSDVSALMPPVFLTWLLKHRKDIMSKTKRVVQSAHYVMGVLGGLKADEAYNDWGHMSGWMIGFDARTKTWSEKQMESMGIPLEILPPVKKPWDVVGTLCKKQADILGLREGIPLVAGSGDIMQSNLGSGVVDYGMCSDVAGTASIFTVDVEGVKEGMTNLSGYVYTICTLEDHYMYYNYLPGGLSLGWFRENLLMKGDDNKIFQELDRMAEKVPIGSYYSLFFPYIQGGNMSLPNASGAWLGLYGSNNAASFWRSMLEAIAFEYLSYTIDFKSQGIPVKEVIGIGGGSKSDLWNQIKADTLDTPYTTLKRSEGAVLGNALLAAYGVGDIKDMKKTIREWIEIKKTYRPRKENTEMYSRIYEQRKKILHGPMKEIFTLLTELHDREK